MVTFAALYTDYFDKRAESSQDVKSTGSEGEFCHARMSIGVLFILTLYRLFCSDRPWLVP